MNYGSTYVFAMLVSSTFGLASLMASAHRFSQPGFKVHVLLVLVGTLLAIPIHEAGHWLAGAAQGFKTLRFLLGPIEVMPVDGGWRIRLVKFRHAGVVYQVPSSFTNFRLQKATCLAAGPGVSLIACLLFTRLALRASTALPFWFWMVNAQMCLVGLLQLFPVRFGEAESDGLQLWKLLQGGPAADLMQRDLLADSVNYTPLRPRDWPVDLIRRLAGAKSARYNRYMAYVHALDCENIPAAWSHLEPLLESSSPADGPQYALEGAYFLAYHRGDLKQARQCLAREHRLPEDALRLRAEAAVEWAAGRAKKASELIEQAELTLRAGHPSGNRDFEMDCLSAMRDDIAARSALRPKVVEIRSWPAAAQSAEPLLN
ncbi:MAG TPA: hypothetical protein VKU19_24185 [Bryobacteraceae bacterium]|nr:hypothetical protein [Bryobacteraceae bacterium]